MKVKCTCVMAGNILRLDCSFEVGKQGSAWSKQQQQLSITQCPCGAWEKEEKPILEQETQRNPENYQTQGGKDARPFDFILLSRFLRSVQYNKKQ